MLRRFQRWVGQFLGFTSAETPDESPEDILARQKSIFSEKISRYDRALASRAALCDVLRRQIKELELERSRLETALQALAKAAQPDRSAGDLALRFESASRDLEDLQGQLQKAQESCEHVADAREEAIEEARAKLAELKEVLGQDRIAKTLAEISNPSQR